MPDLAVPAEPCSERPLFGGSISSTFPQRFQDLSNIREVPDHQEAIADPNRDESLIIELLDLKQDVADNQSALWFLQDLANEQESSENLVVENVSTLASSDVPFLDPTTIVTAAVGQMIVCGRRRTCACMEYMFPSVVMYSIEADIHFQRHTLTNDEDKFLDVIIWRIISMIQFPVASNQRRMISFSSQRVKGYAKFWSKRIRIWNKFFRTNVPPLEVKFTQL